MPRILIVDDDSFSCLLLSNALQKSGYESVSTDDGLAALHILAHDAHFDAIVSDIRMPKMDGFRLLDELTICYPNIPVIISSVHTEAAVIDAVIARGASFLPRPFTLEALIEAVHRVAV